MELHLQPQADVCFATGAAFQEDDRVVSLLLRDAGEFKRYDFLETAESDVSVPGDVLCRWTRTFKLPDANVNPEHALKLTAETLFLSLTEEGGDSVGENGQLKQFLALMLERKRVIKRRGVSVAGHIVYEHMSSKRMIEIPSAEMDAAFFVSVREKLGVLLGEPATPAAPSISEAPAPPPEQ